eukprot:1362345-Amphidinium_carterae.1
MRVWGGTISVGAFCRSDVAVACTCDTYPCAAMLVSDANAPGGLRPGSYGLAKSFPVERTERQSQEDASEGSKVARCLETWVVKEHCFFLLD